MKVSKSRVNRKKARKPRSKKTLIKLIKNVAQRQLEKKESAIQTTSTALCNNAGQATVCQSITLDLSQGVTEGTRVGNQVRLTKLKVKGYVYCNAVGGAGNVTRLPCTVRLVLCKVRQQVVVPTAGQLALILQDGASAQPMDWTYRTLVNNINTDLFEVIAQKQLKIGTASFSQAGTGNTVFPNNDFSLMKKFSFNVVHKKGKLLKYQDALTPATNHAYFLVAQYVNVDASQDVATNFPIQVNTSGYMYFTDA